MKTSLHRSCVTLVAVTLGLVPLLGNEPFVPDLQSISKGVGSRFSTNMSIRWEKDVKGKPALFTPTAIWLDDIGFAEGTIECDILGKSSPRGSNFPGIAFNGTSNSVFECVYFRPFNFRAANPENASHAVQYIAHPQWTWQKLRAEKAGQYEKPIAPSPDGDAWFRAKIVVTARTVNVFVNDASRPCLEVERLRDHADGKIAIWGGDAGDGGYFTNLTIAPKE